MSTTASLCAGLRRLALPRQLARAPPAATGGSGERRGREGNQVLQQLGEALRDAHGQRLAGPPGRPLALNELGHAVQRRQERLQLRSSMLGDGVQGGLEVVAGALLAAAESPHVGEVAPPRVDRAPLERGDGLLGSTISSGYPSRLSGAAPSSVGMLMVCGPGSTGSPTLRSTAKASRARSSCAAIRTRMPV